jgi:hypothetical protein
MSKRQTTKLFYPTTTVAGWVFFCEVSFSPAPEPGVLTELARFEAQRLINHLAAEEIETGSQH